MELPKITLEWLKQKNACVGGYKYCAEVKITEPLALIQRLIDDDHNDWANWLIVRIMDRTQNIKYAIHAAEIALPFFEKKYPEVTAPRNAINAAKLCLENDKPENRQTAAAARVAAYAADAANAAAAYAAADAAYAAYAAANAAAFAACAAYAAEAAAADADAYADADAARNKILKQILEYGIGLLQEEKE
jgi:hypothetical protein